MSAGYPSLRPQPDPMDVIAQNTDNYGIPNVMMHGLQKEGVKSQLANSHALEHSEQQWWGNQEKMDFVMLRNSQGLHAPVRLQMERHTAKQIQRLPCLHSSNVMLDNLTGKLDTMEFPDILNTGVDAEEVGNPHAMVEKRLGLL